MKKITIFLAVAAVVFFLGVGFKSTPKPELQAFDKGEHLSYGVKYSLYVNVGVASMDFYIEDELKEFAGHDCLHLRAVGKTYKFYDYFFKVRDYFDAYVDANEFTPKFFMRNIREGGYKKKEYYVFNTEKNMVKTDKKKEYEIPSNTWDILSIWYLARKFDYGKMNVGDSVMFNTFIDKEDYPIGLRFLGEETIEVDEGTFKCYVIKPLLIAGELFESEDEMTLWVSADKNHIPIKIESGISVGSVTAELKGFENLKYPLTSKVD